MTENNEPRPLAEVVKELAEVRQNVDALQEYHDRLLAEWQEAHAGSITALADCKRFVKELEAEVRTRGTIIAEQTREAPCPGTKVRFERVVRYEVPDSDGVLVQMDQARVTQTLTDWLIAHAARSLLKPDQTAAEKMAKSMPPEEWPTGMRLDWQTVLSIDKDLSKLLENESAPRE
jgi:hypothetical protein